MLFACKSPPLGGTGTPAAPQGPIFDAVDFGAGLTPVIPINGETIVAHLATLGVTPDFSRFALYYNHNRVTYPVKRTEEVAQRTTDFFWYNTTDADPATNDTYTFKTRVFSTLMSVVGDNAAAQADGATQTVPTPASSVWTIAILALVALGSIAIAGRKVTFD